MTDSTISGVRVSMIALVSPAVIAIGRNADPITFRPGIPKDIEHRMFQSFVTSGKKGGTGLGLAITKRIAEEHGGTISHQHGVGRDHAPNLALEKGPLGMATLAELCRHFDPKRIMNPGKLLQDGGSELTWAS